MTEDGLLFGDGSDEIVMIISRALLGPGKNAVMATPTFPQYAHNARIEGAEVREIGLIDGQHDLRGIPCRQLTKIQLSFGCAVQIIQRVI